MFLVSIPIVLFINKCAVNIMEVKTKRIIDAVLNVLGQMYYLIVKEKQIGKTS